ncbi:MAG: peptidoglycan recognition family protein [Chloroflexota bacterium]
MLEIIDVIDKLPRKPGDRNWRTRPLDAITKIVVHYDAVRAPAAYDPVKRYIEQARYHIGKNWNEGSGPAVRGFGLMYHYRVSSDGRIWRTQPDELITWHARAANYHGLAVCCDLGPGQITTKPQTRALAALLDHLCYHRPDFPAGRRDVWGHGELTAAGNHTPCPGGLLDFVQAYRTD